MRGLIRGGGGLVRRGLISGGAYRWGGCKRGGLVSGSSCKL